VTYHKFCGPTNELRDKIEFVSYGETAFFSSEHLATDYLSGIYNLETIIYDTLDRLEPCASRPRTWGGEIH